MRLSGLASAALSLSLGLSLGACQRGDEAEIEVVRKAPPEAAFAKPNASSAERFGSSSMAAPEAQHDHGDDVETPFAWETPDGWLELAPARFRELNFQPAGDPDLECYLTILQGDGGGLEANVNRWRTQLGLGPASQDQLAALPRGVLLGQPAARVELENEAGDRALMGVVLISQGFLSTLKMTGPPAKVEQQRGGFDMLCDTLVIRADGGAAPSGAQASAAPRFRWETPAGWVELAPAQFRDLNFQPAGDEELDCYLTMLSGDGGGLEANVNRWRTQLGLGPLSAAEIGGLPRGVLFGQQALRVELESATGERALMGVVLVSQGFLSTLKMTGPRAKVEQQRGGFDMLCETLVIDSAASGGGTAASGGQAPAGGGAAVRGVSGDGQLRFDPPAGWSDAGTSSMRVINLQTEGGSQCYVIRLTGEAGGLANNLNRWRGEVGFDPLGDVEIDALPKVSVLGRECGLLELSGEYKGMGSLSGPGMTLLGVALIDSGSSLFIKMVGPAADVASEKAHFIEFLSSLKDA